MLQLQGEKRRRRRQLRQRQVSGQRVQLGAVCLNLSSKQGKGNSFWFPCSEANMPASKDGIGRNVCGLPSG